MEMIFKRACRNVTPRKQEIRRRGLIATVDHDRKTIAVEFRLIDEQTMREAGRLVHTFILKGYDNI